MRGYEYQTDGTRFRLQLRDRPRPVLQPGQVRVGVRASALNYRDLINLKNLAGRNVAGKLALSDGAGVVLETAGDCPELTVGDRVAGLFFQTWQTGRFEMRHHQNDLGGTLDGVLAEEIVLPATGVIPIPAHLSFEEAACLPCAGLTAWYALCTRGGLQAGESVLVLGTGGVSIFALQFAVALGAEVYVTSSSDEKLTKAKALGATHTVNYKTSPDWEKEIHRLTQKKGVDHVVEVGGPGTLEKSLACVAAGGQIALIGVLTGFGAPTSSLFPLVAKNARMDGIYVGPRSEFTAMNAFLAHHAVRPVIDRVFAFEDAPAAFDYLESGSHFGKVVIQHAPSA
jgi:NADPH:quinone reductase-like Zn-dependent oxidoreductase